MTTRLSLISIALAALASAPLVVQAQEKPASSLTAAPSAPKHASDSTHVPVAPAVAPLLMLDPTELRSKPTLAQGCWVWMFPDTDYKGTDDIAIAGPADVKSLHTPLGLDWHQKAESLIVGPKAGLTVYEVEGFRGKERTFPPGFKVQQLRKDLGFIQSIDSLKLSCQP